MLLAVFLLASHLGLHEPEGTWTAIAMHDDSSCTVTKELVVFMPDKCQGLADNTVFSECADTNVQIQQFDNGQCTSPIAPAAPFPADGACADMNGGGNSYSRMYCYNDLPDSLNPFRYSEDGPTWVGGMMVFSDSKCEDMVMARVVGEGLCEPSDGGGSEMMVLVNGMSYFRTYSTADCTGASVDYPVPEDCIPISSGYYGLISPEWPPSCGDGCRFIGAPPSSRRRRLLFGAFDRFKKRPCGFGCEPIN